MNKKGISLLASLFIVLFFFHKTDTALNAKELTLIVTNNYMPLTIKIIPSNISYKEAINSEAVKLELGKTSLEYPAQGNPYLIQLKTQNTSCAVVLDMLKDKSEFLIDKDGKIYLNKTEIESSWED